MTKPLKKQFRDKLNDGYCTTAPDGRKGKRTYATKSQAKRAMKSANKSADHAPGARRGTYVYLCRCGCWHVTSQGSR